MEFDEFLDETVASTMKQVIGEGPCQALFHHIGSSPSADGGKPFFAGLENITGSGAQTIERLILRALYEGMGKSFEANGPVNINQEISRVRAKWGAPAS